MGNFDKKDLKFVGLNVVLAVVVVIVVLVALIVWLRGYTQHGVEVEVADVRGMVQAEAEPLLHSQGLKLEIIDSTYTDKVPLGTIVEQNPRPQSHAKKGRPVYVTINATTKRQITMPNLQDISYRQAETTLRGLGFKVDEEHEYKPSQYRDLVLDVKANGVSVQPGAKLPVGTRVKLVVGFGRGTEYVSVPNVCGLTLQDARKMLLTRRLIVGSVYFDEPETEGIAQFVYRQVPEAGARAIEGETVGLRLSADRDKISSSASANPMDGEDSWF